MFNLIFADGNVVLTKDKVPLSIPTVAIMGMRVTKSGLSYKISMDLVGLTMYWDGDRVLTIEATAGLFNRTAGLCGTLDQSIGNDFVSRDGTFHKVNLLRIFLLCFSKFSRYPTIYFLFFCDIYSWLHHLSIRGKCKHRTK